MMLLGMTPLDLHWAADGIVPLPGGGFGLRAWLIDHGLGTAAGLGLYAFMMAAFLGMVVGYRSALSVLMAYVGLLLESYWNRLPLSSANSAMTAMMFCLIWAHTGRVWSMDAKRAPVFGAGGNLVPAWPLYLIRIQIAVIYFTSGLWKIVSPAWRDGSAVHWSLNANTFHRFPWILPSALDPLIQALTWGTLLFELAFPLLVLSRYTRRLTILAGVGLHISLGLTLEVGVFTPVMLAGYLAFLEPNRVPVEASRWKARLEQMLARLKPGRSRLA
jgi:hypothetical protein